METEKRKELIIRNTEEVLGEDEIIGLIDSKVPLKHYIGFEISGKIHLGTGIMTALKINDLIKARVKANIFLADWHTWINDKLMGDREVIKKVAVGYFREGFIAAMKCVKGNEQKLNFVLGSELYHNNDAYWETLIDVSKHTTLGRMQRSITIMGRKEGESVDFAKLIYPPMQVADIFIQGVNIAHAGMDQRKAHVIMRDVALKLKIHPMINKKEEKYKPIAIHHPLILGLQKPPTWPVPRDRLKDLWSAMKMSKSQINSAVFIHDTPEEIRNKINNAFCPEREISFNPILDWAKKLFFVDKKFKLKIERPKKYGGDLELHSYENLEREYSKGLHPLDLKNGMAEALVKLLEPARKHFAKPKINQMKEELEKIKITK